MCGTVNKASSIDRWRSISVQVLSTCTDIDSHSDRVLSIRTGTTIRSEAASRTRFQTYLRMNPELAMHAMYDSTIPDSLRMKDTRFRLSSHRLKVETGRWTKLNHQATPTLSILRYPSTLYLAIDGEIVL